MSKYDAIIIGAGLGGLECGAILSKEGLNVCVLDKNRVAGGCLQSFSRRGHLIDTGIHYIGSMGPGQTLNQYLRYFGVLDKLRLRRMDEEGFDVIRLGEKEYRLGVGYERFTDTLTELFPNERKGLEQYCDLLRVIGATIDVDTLRRGHISMENLDYFTRSASGVIESLIGDETLRNVLAGNSPLYDGVRDVTPLYPFAMISNSFIEGPYRFEGGSQQLADALVAVIEACGGEVRTNAEVVAIGIDGRRVRSVTLASGEELDARNVISSLHPTMTYRLLTGSTDIRKSYFSKTERMKNTHGTFSAYLLMKKGRFPYDNHNHYFRGSRDGWSNISSPLLGRFESLLMCMQVPLLGPYAEVVNLLTMVDGDEFAEWEDTRVGGRGAAYDEHKARMAEAMIDFVSQRYPGFRDNIEAVYTSSPLTYRDYTGVPGGSSYGIMKDCTAPIANMIPVHTKLENLLLTGQNVNIHGALGVTITAARTCAKLLGTEYLAKKIGYV